MKNRFDYPTVKHDITVTDIMIPNASGELIEGCRINISGPGLPGIHYPYVNPNTPPLLQRLSLPDLLRNADEERPPLWGNYWQQGQLCMLAGDMGSGKSTLALQLGKALAMGNSLLGKANGCQTQKVLFIGFELSGPDLLLRYGKPVISDNFFYVNLNADAFATQRATLGERMVTALDDMITETGATVVIIDQPDRMHLSPAMWNYFMLKLNALKVQKGLSILITLNNKPRNLSKAPTVGNIYKSNLLAPHADSIVAIANHARKENRNYIKLLKNSNQPFAQNALMEVFEMVLQNTQILLQPRGTEHEEKVLHPTAAERKNTLMITAENMRRRGYTFREIAVELEMPERTVRSWVSCIEVGEEETINTRSSSLKIPPPVQETHLQGEGFNNLRIRKIPFK